MIAPEIIDAEFEEVYPARAQPKPGGVDYVLAALFLSVVAAVGFALGVGGLALLDRVDWAFAGTAVGGIAAVVIALAWWRLTLGLLALAGVLAVVASFGLLVPLIAAASVVALLGVAAWGVVSTGGRR